MHVDFYFSSEVKDYMNDSVKYVVTNEDWDDHFDEVLNIKSSHLINFFPMYNLFPRGEFVLSKQSEKLNLI